jgi:peptidoglycan/LPS O-acetylase OafA/YrhL
MDLVRGVLCLLIVYQHCINLGKGTEPWWGQRQIPVNIFVLLSGFWIYFGLKGKQINYFRFLRGRVLKLWPSYIAALVVALALRPWIIGNQYELAREASEHQHFWVLLLAHISMMHGLIPEAWISQASLSFLPPAWFVSLIFQLYMLAPALMALSEEWLWRVFAISLMFQLHPISYQLHHWVSPLGSFAPQKLYLFIIGMLLACYWPSLGRGKAPSVLRPLVYLGEKSYFVYLIHYPLLSLIYR